MQAFRKKRNLATYHKWVWELKSLYPSPLISTIRKIVRIKYGSQSESDLTRKALSTPAYLRTLIRYTLYLWKQIIDISTIMTTVEYWWLSDNKVHCLPICWVTTSSPTAMILWPFPPTVHIHRSMLKSNQYPLEQLRSGVVMGEFNSFTFLSNATAQHRNN